MAEPAEGARGPFLVCPRCRHLDDAGALFASGLRPDPAGLACTSCGATFPVVDGVPLLLRDVDEWLRGEASVLLSRRDLPGPVLDRIAAGAGGALLRDRGLAAIYAASREGALQDWATEVVARLQGEVVDLGCGAGIYRLTGSSKLTGVDLNWTLLREHPGARVLADALDPPFLPGSFDHVLLFNSLDSCRDPATLLAAADGLLRPGGSLVLSCAFAWQPAVTPPPAQLSEADLRAWLAARGYGIAHEAELDWPLRAGPRTRYLHRALALHAHKPARAP